MKATLIMTGVAVALTACVPTNSHDYHGTVSATSSWPAESSVDDTTTPSQPPAAPVTISGNGESVQTADLQRGGYIVNYTAATHCLIAAPVQSSGNDGVSIVNNCGQDMDSGVAGTTTFHASGRTTVHVYNTEGQWSLTFTPMT